MHERRKSIRKRTILGGVIAFNRRCSSMNCVLRNLSPEGAKVVFDNTATVPDEFDLSINQQKRSLRARVIWRRVDQAGLMFLDASDADAPIPLEWARRLRECQREKAILERRVAELSTGV